MAYNQSAGYYGGPHRPQMYSLDQIYGGQAGPLYTPPPNPTDSTKTGKANAQPFQPIGGGGAAGGGPAAPSWTMPKRASGSAGPANFGQASVRGGGNDAARVNWQAGGGGPEMPELPQLDFGKLSFSGPVDRSRATGALDTLGRNVRLSRQRRAELGGPADDNDWETMARDMFGGGFDPGQQYS
ncbi:MAG: hypothetical protein E6Q97_13465, partial [Desulfurellales bacterium]